MRAALLPGVLVLASGCAGPDPIVAAWVGLWQVTRFEESVPDDCEVLTAADPPGAFVNTNISQGFGIAADLVSVFPCESNVDCSGAPWVTGVLDELTETDATGSDATFAYFSNGTTLGAGGVCTLQLQALHATVDGDVLVVDVTAATEESLLVESERECSEVLAELEEAGACDARARLEAQRVP